PMVNPISASPAGPAAAHEPPPHGARLTRGEVLAIFAFWLFMAVLTAANRLLDPRRPPGIQPTSPSVPVALAFAESLVWALVTCVIFLLSRRLFAARERRWTQVAALAV